MAFVALTAPGDGVVLSIATISEHPVQAGAPLVTLGDPAELEVEIDDDLPSVATTPGHLEQIVLNEKWA